jgi:hypothetical protein
MESFLPYFYLLSYSFPLPFYEGLESERPFFRIFYKKVYLFFIFTWTNGQGYFILLILALKKSWMENSENNPFG